MHVMYVLKKKIKIRIERARSVVLYMIFWGCVALKARVDFRLKRVVLCLLEIAWILAVGID